MIYIQHDGSRGIHWRPIRKAGNYILPSNQPMANPSSGSENRTRSSERRFNRNLEKRDYQPYRCGRHDRILCGHHLPTCDESRFDVTLASDAHLTRDNEVLTAANIIAHHNFVLDDFGVGDHVVRVKPTDEIVF